MALDAAAARRAIERQVAAPLGLSAEAAARGILAIIDNNMMGAHAHRFGGARPRSA